MRKKSTVARINIEGELNIFTSAALKLRLLDAIVAGKEVEVDLSQVSEIDSAGIQLMVAAKSEAAAQRKPLHFTGHSPAVFDIVELYDLSGYFGDPLLIHSRI
jgi:anti-sigma B factor antagonist